MLGERAKRLLLSALLSILASVASGVALFASQPSFDFSALAWVGLVPLLLVVSGKRPGAAFLLSYLTGGVFFLGIFDWILEISGYTWLHHGILAVYLGSYFAVFGLLFTLIRRRLGLVPALIAAPFFWIPLEYLRSNMSFMALPWALLSHSQFQNPLFIQIASLTGAYGVSFVIVLVNAGFTCFLTFFVPLAGTGKGEETRKQGRVALVSVTVMVFLFVIAYGFVKIREPLSGETVKIALVQGNIDQSRKWDPKYATEIMEVYTGLTLEAFEGSPSLVVWPETATPRAINSDQAIYQKVKNLANSKGTHILLGSAQLQKFRVQGGKKGQYHNSAFLIGPEKGSNNDQRYDKVRLMTFGEYLPYKEKIPWSVIGIQEVGGYLPGNQYRVLKHPQIALGVTICWENIFPEVVREFVRNGAQCIVNITNEAWFGKTAAPYQFLSMSVFRAVEQRLYVLRCANTGISCVIDPCGRVVDRIEDSRGLDIFVRGFMNKSIVPLQSKTIYNQFGDWFAWLCVLVSVLFLVVTAFKKSLSDSQVAEAHLKGA
ncbi:MAG: lnt [Deltaproteobacteria bacterium]|nr:lnt [Deltaproteobacteria bacterium]